MIKIQEPSRPWGNVYMDLSPGLPPGGEKSYNPFLVIVERLSNTPIFFQCHKEDKVMDTSLLIWNRVLFRTKLSFSTAYHLQTGGLAESMIKTLEDMVRRFCAYGLKLKYCDELTHDWCTLLPSLDLSYKTSIHASTNQNPALLEKGWNPRLPQDSLRKDLVEIQPTAARFKGILDKTRKHEER
ncbi:hypothetical protein O181_037979 [Austropuccinia psidii MF-1]|uniref:Integrase catalytic domain-containing protein n=1 Tax=Austropuccinia psidii MF-1 TaxID=1389203 RepID=A0A9Q3HD49_9BASI|nr:hypothetical protein [Austropuccinia psidii MF-1]